MKLNRLRVILKMPHFKKEITQSSFYEIVQTEKLINIPF